MIEQTSLQAYKEIQRVLPGRNQEVFNALAELCEKFGDATDQEIKAYLRKYDANYVRPRRFELVNEYKVVGSNHKRMCKVTGKTAIAWKILRRNLQ